MVFILVLYPGRVGIWRCWVFLEEGKPENPEKFSRSMVSTNHKLSLHMAELEP